MSTCETPNSNCTLKSSIKCLEFISTESRLPCQLVVRQKTQLLRSIYSTFKGNISTILQSENWKDYRYNLQSLFLPVEVQIHLLKVQQQIIWVQVNFVRWIWDRMCNLSCSFNLPQCNKCRIVRNSFTNQLGTCGLTLINRDKWLSKMCLKVMSMFIQTITVQHCYFMFITWNEQRYNVKTVIGHIWVKMILKNLLYKQSFMIYV